MITVAQSSLIILFIIAILTHEGLRPLSLQARAEQMDGMMGLNPTDVLAYDQGRQR